MTAMLKDMHLIEAALVSDKTVISLDETARNLFCEITDMVPQLKSIMWVNPTSEGEASIDWLRSGAKSNKKLQLGSQRRHS